VGVKTQTRAERTAEGMGRRAGEALRDYGTPSPCPFPKNENLARAWARGYAAANLPAGAARARPSRRKIFS
jgi:hypothetical protein